MYWIERERTEETYLSCSQPRVVRVVSSDPIVIPLVSVVIGGIQLFPSEECPVGFELTDRSNESVR